MSITKKVKRSDAFTGLLQTREFEGPRGILELLPFHILNVKPGSTTPVRRKNDKLSWGKAWNVLLRKTFIVDDKQIKSVKRKEENQILKFAMPPSEWLTRYPLIMTYADKSNTLLGDPVTPPGKSFFLLYYYTIYLKALLLLRNVAFKRPQAVAKAYHIALFSFIKDVKNSSNMKIREGLKYVHLTESGKEMDGKNEWENSVLCRFTKLMQLKCAVSVTLPLPVEFFGTLLGEKTESVSIHLSMWWPQPLTMLFQFLLSCKEVRFSKRDTTGTKTFFPPLLADSVNKLVLSNVILPNVISREREGSRFEDVLVQPRVKELSLRYCWWKARDPAQIEEVYRKTKRYPEAIPTEIGRLRKIRMNMSGEGITGFVRAVAPNCETLYLQRTVPPSPVRAVGKMEHEVILPLDFMETEEGVFAGLPLSVKNLALVNMYSGKSTIKIERDMATEKGGIRGQIHPFEEEDLLGLLQSMPGMELLETFYLRGKEVAIRSLARNPFRGLNRLDTLSLVGLVKLKRINPSFLQEFRSLKKLAIKKCPYIGVFGRDEILPGRDGTFFLSPAWNTNEYEIEIEESGTFAWKNAVSVALLERERFAIEREKQTELRQKRRKRKRKLVKRSPVVRSESTSGRFKDDLILLDEGAAFREDCRLELPNPFHSMAVADKRPWWYRSKASSWSWMKNWGITTHIDLLGRGVFFFEIEDEGIPLTGGEQPSRTIQFDKSNPGNFEQVYVQEVRLTTMDFDKKNLTSLIATYGWVRNDRIIPVLVNFGGDSDEFVSVISLSGMLLVSMEDPKASSRIDNNLRLIRNEGIFKGIDLVAGAFKLYPQKKTLEFGVTLTQLMRIMGAQVLSCMLALPVELIEDTEYIRKDWESDDLVLPGHLVNLRSLIYTIMLDIEGRPRDRNFIPIYRAAMDNSFILMWQMAVSVFVFVEYAKNDDVFKELVDGRRLSLIKSKLADMVQYINASEISPAIPGMEGYRVLTEDVGDIILEENAIGFPLPSSEFIEVEDALLNTYLKRQARNERQQALMERATTLASLLKKKGITLKTSNINLQKMYALEVELEDEGETQSSTNEEDLSEESKTLRRVYEQALTGDGQTGLKRRKALLQQGKVLGGLMKFADDVEEGRIDPTVAANQILGNIDQAFATSAMLVDPTTMLQDVLGESLQKMMGDAVRSANVLSGVIKTAKIAFEMIKTQLNLYMHDQVQASINEATVRWKYYHNLAEGITDALEGTGMQKMDFSEATICVVCERVTEMQCPECKVAYCTDKCMDLDREFHHTYLNCSIAVEEIGDLSREKIESMGRALAKITASQRKKMY